MSSVVRGQGKLEKMAVAGASTNSYAALDDSDIDMRGWRSLSYTLSVFTDNVDWEVYAANASDFSGEILVQAEATITAGATGTFTTTVAAFNYFRVKIKSTVTSTPGDVSLYALAVANG
jgi:hypothetical protein